MERIRALSVGRVEEAGVAEAAASFEEFHTTHLTGRLNAIRVPRRRGPVLQRVSAFLSPSDEGADPMSVGARNPLAGPLRRQAHFSRSSTPSPNGPPGDPPGRRGHRPRVARPRPRKRHRR